MTLRAAAGLFLAISSAALGQKTDVIELQNGDKVTGEIKSYAQGRLTVDSIMAGFVSVKWDRIAAITSDKQYEIETADAVYHYGTLRPSTPRGKLVIVSEERADEVAFLDVVRFSPLYETFWRRLEGSLDLGFNYEQANNLVQFTLNANATARRPTFSTSAALSVFYNRQEGVDSTQRANLLLAYQKFLKNRWFVGGFGGLDRNLDLGVDLRVSLGAGVGREFIQTNQTNLRGIVGVSGEREEPTDGSSVYNVAMVLGASYDAFTYRFPKVTFGATLQVLPYLSDAGRVRLHFSTQIKREIVHDFYLTLSVFDDFDSRDPSTQEAKNDWGPVLAIGWQF